MVEYLTNRSFVQIVYAKVKSNGKTELVPMKLYVDRSSEQLDRDLASAPATSQGKRFLANRYELHRILGQGGFGRTYLTIDRHRFDETCVVKEFLPQHRGDYEAQKSRELFEREAKILASITHPQIPKFFAYFEEDRQLFLVQEYIKGRTYAALLRERQLTGDMFSELEIIQWLTALLPVLGYLHGRQIVHRDISLDNIMLQDDTHLPILIDFGIGRADLVRGDHHSANVVVPTLDRPQQSIVGKVGYAPHEQIWLGQSFPSSDLYALAVTAVVLLTGIEPQSLTEQPSLKSTWQHQAAVSPGVVSILNRMLQDPPDRRYQSAIEVLADLERLTAAPQTQLSRRSTDYNVTTMNVSPVARQPQISATPEPTAQFIARCERELLTYIGPVAKFIVQKTFAAHPHLLPAESIAILAQYIPQHSHAVEFRERLLQR